MAHRKTLRQRCFVMAHVQFDSQPIGEPGHQQVISPHFDPDFPRSNQVYMVYVSKAPDGESNHL